MPEAATLDNSSVTVSPERASLARDLGRWQLLAITVGAVVGAGIYIRPAMVAQELREPGPIALAWTLAGFLSLAGALSYAQLASRWPRAGGEYIYLGQTIGEFAAFLFGWMRLTVGVAVAALQATAVVVFLSQIVPIGGAWFHWSPGVAGTTVSLAVGPRQLIAIAIIAGLAYLNCRGVGTAGRFQTVVTILKIAALLSILAVLLAFGHRSPSAAATGIVADPPTVFGWSAALLGAVTTFNGWTNAAMLAGETKNAERAVPWALTWGIAIAIACYLAMNFAFVMVLSINGVASGNSALHPDAPSVASLAITAAVGRQGSAILSAVLALSALGALHVGLLASPRVFFAMAEDQLLPTVFGRVNPSTRAPTGAIVGYAVFASVLATLGNFDQLSNMAGVGFLTFYALNVFGLLLLLARTRAAAARSLREVAGASVAVLFLCGTSGLLVTIVARGDAEIVSAVTLVAAGIPAYWLARRVRARNSSRTLARPIVTGWNSPD